MGLRFRSLNLAAFFCFVLIGIQVSKSAALVFTQDSTPPYPKAISDLKEAIVKGLGFQADEFKISGFDLRDAQVGKSVAYEFDVEIDNKVMPFKLLEDVKRWEYVDLPIFQTAHSVRPGEENGLVESKQFDDNMPVLAPFQLAGPMELWIQDAKDMRISLPHEVDAGVLKKVILADGAVVTVKGARSVSLRHPIELPLPFNRTSNNFASGLLTLAEWLRNAALSQDGPLLSLRIVGPTSLTSPTSSSPSSNNRLKLKRLAPGLVELSSASKRKAMEGGSTAIDLQGEATALISRDRFSTLWPITSIDGSNSNLVGFEALLSSVLGPKANKEGSFKLLKADVSAQTVVKMGFVVEKKKREGDEFDIPGFPEWRTKPQSVRMHFEVLAKVEGNKVVPESVVQINPVIGEDSVAENVVTGNTTMSKTEKKKNAKREAEEENPEDYVDPETPQGEKKKLSQQMAKHYNPNAVENSWDEYWKQSNFFKADPERSKLPYAMLFPPPNVTGALHIGHTLSAAIQNWTNDEVELDVDMIESVVKSMRSLRSQLPPNERLQRVAAIVRCRTNDACDIIKRHDLEITTLALLSSLTVLSEKDDVPVGCFVDVVNDSLSVFLKQQGSSINVEAEVEKLRKRREETQKQYDSLAKKTSATGYQEKVPACIREADEAKLASLLQEILSFKEASEQLERENPRS